MLKCFDEKLNECVRNVYEFKVESENCLYIS